ncbi:hypothetical protein LIER_06647 [Lithospermum erythrorhizon]|uniref:Uncharacterized protein n=1 Tax=Lithospermum erythrorhizon TaxID=34254 RepID=A0AAV3P9X1_LITER
MMCSSVKSYKKDHEDSDEAWILWTTEIMHAVLLPLMVDVRNDAIAIPDHIREGDQLPLLVLNILVLHQSLFLARIQPT